MKRMSQNSLIKSWEVKNTKIIHVTPWVEILEDTCVADGAQVTYTYTRRVDEGPLIIAEDTQGLWMVKQYRHPIKKIIWQFPVEGKHQNESWEDAAQRGINEELGVIAQSLTELGVFYPDPGGLQQKFKMYLAQDLRPTITPKHADQDDEVEDLEIACFSREEIDRLIHQGEICDNWTLSALFIFDRYKQSLR